MDEFWVAADGATDDTDAIQAALDAAVAEPPHRRIVAMIPDALDRRLAIAVATARRTKVSVIIEAIGDICNKLEGEKPA